MPTFTEAEHIADEDRDERHDRRPFLAVRHLHFQNHDRDDESDHAVVECLKSSFVHVHLERAVFGSLSALATGVSCPHLFARVTAHNGAPDLDGIGTIAAML